MQAPAATRHSKQAKTAAAASATPAKKGKAAAKRAAEPVSEQLQSPKKAAKPNAEGAPLTPIKAPIIPTSSAKEPAGTHHFAAVECHVGH